MEADLLHQVLQPTQKDENLTGWTKLAAGLSRPTMNFPRDYGTHQKIEPYPMFVTGGKPRYPTRAPL